MTDTTIAADTAPQRATFHSMDQGTQEDWNLIATEAIHNFVGLPERLMAHLRLLDGDFGGFAVDRLTHSLQTAARAERAGRDDEYVVCALLHDIGDTLAQLLEVIRAKDGAGSLAMHESKWGVTLYVLSAVLNGIAKTIKRDLLRPLWILNGWDPKNPTDPQNVPTPAWDALEFADVGKVASAISGSVMMVAGLELTSTTSYPSSRRAFAPCVPE